MRLFILVVALFVFLPSKGQDTTIFAPAGSTFFYSTFVLFPYPELITFVSEGDTLINDIQARVLRFYQTNENQLVHVPDLDKYVYTTGNQVYYWVQDSFYLLYDFGAQPGDTIHSRVEDFPISLSCNSTFENDPFSFSYIIDSLGTMDVDGIPLRLQYVTSIYTSEEDWVIESPIVERLGQSSYSSFWWGRGAGCLLGGFPGGLRCYSDEEFQFTNPDTFFDLECGYISATDHVTENTHSIFPNPTNDFVTLPKDAELFFIYDLYGRIIMEGKKESQMSLHDLPSNIYIINYKIENNWITEKIIKN